MRNKIASLVLLVACFLTMGCGGAREPDDVSYIISIGVDRAPGKEIMVTYRVAVPHQLSGDNPGSASKTSTLISITAPSLAEARNILNSSLGRSITLAHTRAFIIGRELAEHGLGDFIGPLLRFREFRGSMFIMVARGTAKELMEKNDPQIAIVESKWLESVMYTAEDSSYFLKTNLHDFYTRLKGQTGAPLAAFAAVNEDKMGTQNVASFPGERAKEYLAGNVPKVGGNPVVVMGTAVFKGDKMMGVLDNEETRMLAILSGKMPRGYIVLDDPLDPKRSLNVNLRIGKEPRIQVELAQDHPVITADILLEGEITSIPSGIFYEDSQYQPELEERISQIVKDEMLRMLQHTQQMESDAADFGYYIRPHFFTRNELEKVEWDKQYPKAEFNINITTKIRRTGLMRKSMPLRRSES